MILSLFKKKPEARPLRDPTPRPALEWIIANNETPLTPVSFGRFETPEGKVSIVDTMVGPFAEINYVDVPETGCEMFMLRGDAPAYRDEDDDPLSMDSKFVLIFSDDLVASGHRVDWCAVDSVSISPVTPASCAALVAYQDEIGAKTNLYTHFFQKFEWNTPSVHLPDGTHFPFMNSNDDGTYPVSALVSASGIVVAVFIDLLGRVDLEDWLIPIYEGAAA